MNPCLVRCVECKFCITYDKRIKCEHGLFDVQYHDGLLFVPLDYDCVSFENRPER